MMVNYMGKSINLFYQNIFRNYNKIYDSVNQGLRKYHQSINRVLKNINVKHYGMKFEKAEVFKYKLYPNYILRMKRNRFVYIILYISYDTFIDSSRNITLYQNDKYVAANIELHEETLEGYTKIVINNDIFSSMSILLGPKELNYKIIENTEFEKEKIFITNDGLEIIGKGREHGQYYEYILDIADFIEDDNSFVLSSYDFDNYSDSELIDIDYDMSTFIDDISSLTISSQYTDKNSNYIIKTSREIVGDLYDEGNDISIEYELITDNKSDKWIRLVEDESLVPEFIDASNSMIDLFIEMVGNAMYQEITYYDKSKKNKIKVFRISFNEGLLLVEKYPPKNELIYPPNVSSQLRKQVKALQLLMNSPSPAHKPLIHLFMDSNNVHWEEVNINQLNGINWKFLVPINGIERQGTDMQKTFVKKAIATKDFGILVGPPGSGKTTTITELIYQLIQEDKKIILSASTHVAIDNVLEVLMAKFGGVEDLKNIGIIPLRIGREHNVSEKISSYLFDNRVNNLKYKLKKEGIELDEKQIENMVIESSNLICGTTMGILAFPNFDIYNYVEPKYDYLIIDEASKTTLQQFLVPAIFAKKWILTGDIKQLSPYTDTLFVRINLEGILKEKYVQKAILYYFVLFYDLGNLRTYNPNLPKFIIFMEKAGIEYFIDYVVNIFNFMEKNNKQFQHMNVYRKSSIAIVANKINNKNLIGTQPHDMVTFFPIDKWSSKIQFRLYNFDIILIESNIINKNITIQELPLTHIILDNDFSSSEFKTFYARHKFIVDKQIIKYSIRKGRNKLIEPLKIVEYMNKETSKGWAGQLSWRLQRIYELENTKNDKSKNYYESSISALSTTKDGNVKNKINMVGQIYFPSILLALQQGIYKRFKGSINNILTNGFESKAFEERHEKLIYQHRMHDSIAKIPRKLFYDNQALQTSEAILSGGVRDWKKNYNEYHNKRYCWIHTKDNDFRNKNDREAEVIVKELTKFVEYAKKVDQTWKILVLSFYNKQKDVIAEKIKYKFNLDKKLRNYFRINKNISIMVYTIDKVQGREADVVFLSMVRNSKIGFMDSPNRINVAITRARFLQVIVGNYDFFRESDSFELRELAKNLMKEKSVFEKHGDKLLNYHYNRSTKHNRKKYSRKNKTNSNKRKGKIGFRS